jgi:hypothetical protein
MMNRIIAAIGLVVLIATSAEAATTPNSVITPQTPNRGIVQFLQGTDTAGTYKTLYTSGANGSKCFGMWSTNNDETATHLITVQVVNATVFYGGTSITSTLGAGFLTGIPPINLVSAINWPGLPLDSDGNPYILLISGDTIQATYATALSDASDVINIVASCADF